MENQNHYFRVGLFIIAVMVALMFVAFRFYGTKVVHYNEYAILFQKDIGGLTVGSNVTLQGINVGSVKDIRLLDDEITVEVIIQVEDRFMVREDTVASLALTSISGAVKVQLENKGFSEEPLLPTAYQDIPLIPSDSSAFEQIFNDAPEIMAAITDLINQARTLFNEDNMQAVSSMLVSTEKITKTLEGRSESINTLFDQVNNVLVNLESGTADLETVRTNLNQTILSADDVINNELKETLANAQKALAQLNSTLAEVKGSTLPQLEQTLQSSRTSLDSISKLGGELSDNPSSIIKEPEYKGYAIVE
ncbi:MAG: MlaD family protein [Alphaproteobacteria bacterium]